MDDPPGHPADGAKVVDLMRALADQGVSAPEVPAAVAVESAAPLSVLDAVLRPSLRARLLRGAAFRSDKERALDAACNEYYDRLDAGDSVELDTFCARFPSIQYSLCRAILTQQSFDARWAAQQQIVWPAAGQTFLGFLLHQELGRGSFARVFLASEIELGDRLVVLKVSPRQYGADEAQTLGRLRHAAIVPIHSIKVDEESGLGAVCMPYLGVATLADLLDRRRSTSTAPSRADMILEAARLDGIDTAARDEEPPEPILQRGTYVEGVIHLGCRLADALAAMHSERIYHRDLKPSNVLLTPGGKPLLLDFNLSADLRQRPPEDGGTLAYMPPEALRALGAPERPSLDEARADIFALGVVLFELLAGQHPYGPLPFYKSLWAARDCLLQRMQQPPASLRRLNPQVEPRLESLLQRCLAAKPEDRVRGAAEFAVELRRLLGRRARVVRWVRRHAAVCSLLAVLGAASMAVAAAAWMARPSPSERMFGEAQAAYRAGNYADAVSAATMLTQTEPTSTRGWLIRGVALTRLGEQRLEGLQESEHAARSRVVEPRATEFAEALRSFDTALQLEQTAAPLARKAYCLLRLGQVDEAITIFQAAQTLNGPSAAIENDLGVAHELAQDTVLADEHFSRAVALDPNLQAAWRNRALLRSAQPRGAVRPDFASALADIEHAFGCGPATTELYADALRIASRASLADAQRYEAACRNFLELALAHGLPLSAAQALVPRNLAALPAFTATLSKSYPPQLFSRSQRVVDPISD